MATKAKKTEQVEAVVAEEAKTDAAEAQMDEPEVVETQPEVVEPQEKNDSPAVEASSEAPARTAKRSRKTSKVETVNIDEVVEQRKTIGSDLQAVIRQRIKEA